MSAPIAVLGPGGVGGLVAAALARAGEPVTVVAREPTAEAIARDGIRVRSVGLGDFSAHPDAVSELEADGMILVITTKATGLAEALERVSGTPELVVPLLNGLEHMAPLRERFGRERVVAAVIRVESERPEPGVIVHTSPFLRIDLASDDATLRPAVEEVVARLEAADIPARVGGSEAEVLWSKLVRLNALACTTSAYDLPLGPIRSTPELAAELEGCIREAAAVADAEGAAIDPRAAIAELAEAHAELGSSMRRDLAAGREPELEAIPGAVLRAGARRGIDCPTIARLSARIAERAGLPAPGGRPA